MTSACSTAAAPTELSSLSLPAAPPIFVDEHGELSMTERIYITFSEPGREQDPPLRAPLRTTRDSDDPTSASIERNQA